jgi:N-acetylglucosamine-6-sulfatase
MKLIAIVILALLASVSTAWAQTPNVVVILTDDQTLADQVVLTKTNNLIGAAGTTFTRFYTEHGLCCPSRATILTGQYEHNHGVVENNPPGGGYTKLDHNKTLAVWMQGGGYYTAYIGKYLNGLGTDPGSDWSDRPPGWDNWQPLIRTYRMYGWTMNDNGVLFTAGDTPVDYQTDAIASRAEGVILGRAANPRPFFLMVAPSAPHKEANEKPPLEDTVRPAPRHVNAYATLPLPKPQSYDEENVSDKPNWIQNMPRITSQVETEITTRFRNRREALLAVDEMVERIVNALITIGQLDNTMIIFSSDNGYHFGEHRIADNKNEIYEESIHVPLLIRGGGFPANVIATQLVSNIDIAPTILAAARIGTVTRVIDGRNLLPLALETLKGRNRYLKISAYHGEARSHGVLTDQWKLAEHERNPARNNELYNVVADPLELRNVYSDPANASIKRQLEGQLQALKGCAGITCSRGD